MPTRIIQDIQLRGVQLPPSDKSLRDPRFAELDRLIAEEDAREAERNSGVAPASPKLLKHRQTEAMKDVHQKQSERWALLRSRRATCTHERWHIHGHLQLICPNCGTTKRRPA